MRVQIRIQFDPRQQPNDVVEELASHLDTQLFDLELERTWWPWAGTDPYHISFLIIAGTEFTNGFFAGAGKELLDWIKGRVLAAWKKPKLAGAPAPFELEIRTADLQLVLRAPNANKVEKALNSAADAATRIIQASRDKPVALRFDPEQESWEQIDSVDIPGQLLAAERSREQAH